MRSTGISQKALSLPSPLEMGRLRQGRGEEMWPKPRRPVLQKFTQSWTSRSTEPPKQGQPRCPSGRGAKTRGQSLAHSDSWPPGSWLGVIDTEIRTKGIPHNPHRTPPPPPVGQSPIRVFCKGGEKAAFQAVMSVLSRPCSGMKSKVW